MKSTSKLKDQARTFEQKEEWEKAINAYLQVLQASEQGDEGDLPLYNRIGDLYVRLGRAQDAVQYYEQAADRYAEAGLYNNAIALCNKALRYVPKQWGLYRKLGQFSASQGFLTDARRWFFEYAEQMFKTGKVDDAFKALTDFVNISDDAEIRELLGKQLHAHGRTLQAMHELRHAYNMRLQAGQTAEAEAVATQMREIDPSVDMTPDAAPAVTSQPHSDALPGLGDIGLETHAGSAFGSEPAAGIGLDAGNISLDDAPDVSSAPASFDHGNITIDDSPFAGSAPDSTDLPTIDLSDAIDEGDEVDVAPLPTYDDADEDAAALPLLDLDTGAFQTEDEEHGAGLLDMSGFETETDDGEDATDYGELPTLSMDGDDAEEYEPLPTFDEPLPTFDDALPAFDDALPAFDEQEDVTPAAGYELEPSPHARLSVEAEIAAARDDAGSGNRAAALERLTELHPVLAEQGDFAGALQVTAELLRLEPGGFRTLQQQVEYAGRNGDNALLVTALLELAAQLAETGANTKARAVYKSVQDLDPANAKARAALETKASSRAKPGGDYVDLNAFLQGDDDDEEDNTRFVVAEKAPTGDEERDFADLLSQFKAKVAENVGADDPASHYDLGLAFKEMGLVDEAISEFQVALKGGQEKLQVYEELGQCFMMKEQYNVAVKVLNRALQMPRSDEAELLGVYYHLGRCFEELGNRGEAKDAYERVIGLDIQFRDVTQRLARL